MIKDMLTLKQYFCRHDFREVAKHIHCSESLSKCKKCNVYQILHFGIYTWYLSKTPHIDGWRY